MTGLTTLGTFHTAIGVVSLITGAVCLVRDKEISPRNRTGQIYVATTVIACLTGFGIFQHGGFGKPHALGIITLLVFGIAAMAGARRMFGSAAAKVQVVCYSATYLFNWIPTITETSTRLPPSAPLVTDRDGPELQAAAGVLFLLFLIGAALQLRRMSTKQRAASTSG